MLDFHFIGQLLTIEVFDHDDPGDDEFLGRATVSTSVVEERGHIEKMWAELEDVKSGKVQLSLSWLEATTDKSVLQGWYTYYISTFLIIEIRNTLVNVFTFHKFHFSKFFRLS